MEMPKEIQQKVIEIRIVENQIKNLEEQLAMIEQHLLEFQALNVNLDEVKSNKQKEMFVPLGRDVFLKAELKSSDNVLVNVGANVVLEMPVENAKHAVEKQKLRIIQARDMIMNEVNKLLERFAQIEQEINAMQGMK